jgi:hypothetical protein
MMSVRRTLFVFVLLALFVSLPLAAGSAKGSFTANGKKVTLSYAYATTIKNPFDKKKTDVLVVVTDKDIPSGAQFDEFAMMSLVDKGITGFTVEIDADKRVNSGTLFSPAFKKMHQFSSVGKQELNLTAFTKDHIAGTITMPASDFFDEKYEFKATVDLPVQAKPAEKPVTLKGTPLPADGGEPGKAWMAYRKAISAGDIGAIRKSVVKDMAKQTEDPDFKKMLGVIQAMQPKKVKIKSGSVDGDTATLLVDSLDEKNTSGTVTLQREGGQWKLAKEDWKTKSD